jgi:ComF family protein
VQFLKDTFYLFFPKICACCDEQLVKNEIGICLKCRFELPITSFTDVIDNEVEQTFYGRVKIEFATALLFYRTKGISQKLIYQLKYKGKQELGTLLGKWLGAELKESKRFPSIDYIVPVPLHAKKLKKRGYNQLTTFGNSISEILNIPYINDVLIKETVTDTQTLKHRFERWKNVDEIFHLNDTTIFEQKHVLLIDDVITTGATLEACTLELSKTKNIKISIATIAFTE